MNTGGYDNIEVARELLNIIDWCLECQQIENRNKENTDFNKVFLPFKDINEVKKKGKK